MSLTDLRKAAQTLLNSKRGLGDSAAIHQRAVEELRACGGYATTSEIGEGSRSFRLIIRRPESEDEIETVILTADQTERFHVEIGDLVIKLLNEGGYARAVYFNAKHAFEVAFNGDAEALAELVLR